MGLASALLVFAAEHIGHRRHLLYKKNRLIMERHGNKRIALAMIEKWAEIKLDKPAKRAELPKIKPT